VAWLGGEADRGFRIAITLFLNLAVTMYVGHISLYGCEGLIYRPGTHLEDALFLNLLLPLTASCGGGSFNHGSHHSLFVVTQTRQARGRVRRAGGSKRPSAVDSIVTCCPEPAHRSIRTPANGAPRPRKSMRAFVFGVAARGGCIDRVLLLGGLR
jgi:hypothetical protein